nr:hypothetical protein GZ9E5_46 [uncultured archaeon GZfos9E5]
MINHQIFRLCPSLQDINLYFVLSFRFNIHTATFFLMFKNSANFLGTLIISELPDADTFSFTPSPKISSSILLFSISSTVFSSNHSSPHSHLYPSNCPISIPYTFTLIFPFFASLPHIHLISITYYKKTKLLTQINAD